MRAGGLNGITDNYNIDFLTFIVTPTCSCTLLHLHITMDAK